MKTIVDLNGKWRFAPTHDQKPHNNHNVIESNLPLYADPRLNRRDWEVVDVPGVWQRYAEKYSIYEGVCWFYREFTLNQAPDAGDLVRLCFAGVDHRATVYVNGRSVGMHESPYTAFTMDVTSLVHEGVNAIAVEVDNRAHITKWPNDWGYGVYGGIHREVTLQVLRGAYLYDIELTPTYDTVSGVGHLSVCGRYSGALTEACVRVGDTEFPLTLSDGVAHAEITVEDVGPWSPACPTLTSVTVVADGVTYDACRIGFREVRCEGGELLLNGSAIPLHGVCYVYDHPKWGLVMDRSQLVEDLCSMKEGGVNAIRTHYPMSRDFYELCDEMGFVVWIEPNVYCTKPALDKTDTVFSRPEYVEAAVSMTREMITDARRYASVILYGIGNECNVEHPEARPFFSLLSETVRKSDATRLIGYASLYGQVGCMADLVDVMGINSYFGWYGTFPTFEIEDKLAVADGAVVPRSVNVDGLGELIERVRGKVSENTVIWLTEFGADSVPAYYSTACELWSENYHAEIIRACITKAREKSVKGTFIFAYTDYFDPSKPKNGRWKEHNLKGMLTYEREKRLAYFAMSEMYGGKARRN